MTKTCLPSFPSSVRGVYMLCLFDYKLKVKGKIECTEANLSMAIRLNKIGDERLTCDSLIELLDRL